ncbi:MAG: 30S ribosomal protein S6e [Candidatus Heimdallarchaeota archaeon]|nr:30S ribosomal protein S6e [Candidatus Heimdallarchaeota archaeon]
MAKFQLNIGDPETGKTIKTIIEGPKATALIGKRISEEVEGEPLGFSGYTFKITGGSDKDGFPMRSHLEGPIRTRILITGGQGFRNKIKGEKQRRLVRGNTITDEIYQVNMKIVQKGKKDLEELITGE